MKCGELVTFKEALVADAEEHELRELGRCLQSRIDSAVTVIDSCELEVDSDPVLRTIRMILRGEQR